jgi:hypothetical protein
MSANRPSDTYLGAINKTVPMLGTDMQHCAEELASLVDYVVSDVLSKMRTRFRDALYSEIVRHDIDLERVALRRAGEVFTDLLDGLSSGASALRDPLDLVIERYRVCLNREIAYVHWPEGERAALRKALKWFDTIVDPAVRALALVPASAPSTESRAVVPSCQTCGQEIPEAPTPSGPELVERFMAAMETRGYDVTVKLKKKRT